MTNLDENGQPIFKNFNRGRTIDRMIDELVGLSCGILCDGCISKIKIIYLKEWLENRPELLEHNYGRAVYQHILPQLNGEVWTSENISQCWKILTDISGNLEDYYDDPSGMNLNIKANIKSAPTTIPLTNPEPEVIFKNRSFCFTGTMLTYTRDEFSRFVKARGGIVHENIKSSTNYLVVGSERSRDWIHSGFGRKIEFAVQHNNQNGSQIYIITEEHLSNFIEPVSK
ncbi:MAG: BRCT domain-containing protein [Magnetococcales bacterium]|nr:BRCT domain-containing protein [Magnetococcales bacterium]